MGAGRVRAGPQFLWTPFSGALSPREREESPPSVRGRQDDCNRDDNKDNIVEYVTGGPLLGDVNLDSVVNGLDVDPFVGALLGGTFQVEADMNADGVVNGLDVDPFVAAVVGGGLQAVPEPSTLALLALASSALVFWRCNRSQVARAPGNATLPRKSLP